MDSGKSKNVLRSEDLMRYYLIKVLEDDVLTQFVSTVEPLSVSKGQGKYVLYNGVCIEYVSIHFTIARAKNVVDFAITRFVKWRFHCS